MGGASKYSQYPFPSSIPSYSRIRSLFLWRRVLAYCRGRFLGLINCSNVILRRAAVRGFGVAGGGRGGDEFALLSGTPPLPVPLAGRASAGRPMPFSRRGASKWIAIVNVSGFKFSRPKAISKST